MALGSELLVLAIYMGQQLGVMLGVGAETVLLVAYLVALHKNETDDGHYNFTQAVRMSQGGGLGLIIVTGLGAVLFHAVLLGDAAAAPGALAVLLAPAFLFKWVLIGIITLCFFLEGTRGGHPVLKGFAGGSWFALFLVHSLAPITTWLELVSLYVAWLLVFAIIWTLFVFIMRHGQSALEAYATRAAQAPVRPVPPPVVPRPAPQPIPPPAPPVMPPAPPPPPPVPMPAPPPPQPRPIPPAPKPIPSPVVVPPAPRPVAPPIPVPSPLPPVAPSPIARPVFVPSAPRVIKENWWMRLLKIFEGEPHVPAPKAPPRPPVRSMAATRPTPSPIQARPVPVPVVAAAPKPAPVPPAPPKAAPVAPANLPVVEHLMLTKAPGVAPKAAAPAPKPTPEPVLEKLDLPTLHIMPQRPEDLHLQYRFDPIMKPQEDVEFPQAA